MRFNSSRLNVAVPHHIHRAVGCPVCCGQPTHSGSSSLHYHQNASPGVSTSSIIVDKTPSDSSFTASPKQAPDKLSSFGGSTRSSATESALAQNTKVVDLRREGLEKWTRQFGSANQHEMWCENVLRGNGVFSANDAKLLVHYLDTKCSRKYSSAPLLSSINNQEELIRIPSSICIPIARRKTVTKPAQTAEIAGNDFLSAIVGAPDKQKQLNFQKALVDVQQAFQELQLPFFLACGTALGAHRDKMFIPHDDDIDLGVMLDSLQELGERSAQKNASNSSVTCLSTDIFSTCHSLTGNPEVPSDTCGKCSTAEENAGGESKAGGKEEHITLNTVNGVIELLSALSNAPGGVVVFDICGEVSKGLEVRVLHTETGVRIDINVYYPPVPVHDDYLIERHGQFIWASSFYEEAMNRKHSMYRFLHKPFMESIISLPFCAKNCKLMDSYFLVPPESYLDEYFGKDWRIVKQFSYAEGLRHEYANIIDE